MTDLRDAARQALNSLRGYRRELGCQQPCDAERALAQRDALLKALNAMLTHMGMDEDEWNKPTFDQARAAIKKAEENT